jgi:hypothetical protein
MVFHRCLQTTKMIQAVYTIQSTNFDSWNPKGPLRCLTNLHLNRINHNRNRMALMKLSILMVGVLMICRNK